MDKRLKSFSLSGDTAMLEDANDLSSRLARLEKLVESMAKSATRPDVADISAEDIAAFRKVRDVIAFDPDGVCGINECFKCVSLCRPCQVCQVVCRVCKVCDFECTCGPCNPGTFAGRFGVLGQ
jgi:hypothetical protein